MKANHNQTRKELTASNQSEPSYKQITVELTDYRAVLASTADDVIGAAVYMMT